MEHVLEEMAEQLRGCNDGMKDAVAIACRMLDGLHWILITAPNHALRIPVHSVQLLFAHDPMHLECLQLKDIGHRPPQVAGML